jgi:transcriptional regulator with XRE-family HTH domain
MENWGKKVKRLREALHLTQDELANKSGVGRSYLSRIELEHYPNYTEELISKLSRGLNKTTQELIMYIYSISPTGSTEDWDRHAINPPLRINIYSEYATVHAGESLEAIDHIYVDRPVTAPFTIQGYKVAGECMEPDMRNGDYIIVDHDRQIDNGDTIVALCDGTLFIARLKIIGPEYWLQNNYDTKKMAECKRIAKVIGIYRKLP